MAKIKDNPAKPEEITTIPVAATAEESTERQDQEVIPTPADEVDPKSVAREILSSNPQLNQIYVTSDGQCFANRDYASLKARELKDKSITAVTRGDI